MSIKYQILGASFNDNALYCVVDSGKKQTHLLFDCGEETLSGLRTSEIQKIDHLFLSHLHLDHVAGLDRFIRVNYDRSEKPVHVWGPAHSVSKIFNRLNSFTWNLMAGIRSTWFLHEVQASMVRVFRVEAEESFEVLHQVEEKPFNQLLVENEQFVVEAVLLDHKIPVLGFKVTEKQRLNIDPQKLAELNLTAGPWLAKVKDLKIDGKQKINLGNQSFTIEELRKRLFVQKAGDSLAYFTDFHFSSAEADLIAKYLKKCKTLICESQYLQKDVELARQNFHLTAAMAANLALRSDVQRLVLFHFSKRYKQLGCLPFLEEAKEIFSSTILPDGWLNV